MTWQEKELEIRSFRREEKSNKEQEKQGKAVKGG